MANRLFKIYKHYVMPHGKHMFQKSSDMAIEIVCAYLSSTCVLPHWKCVLRCCAQYTRIDLPSP